MLTWIRSTLDLIGRGVYYLWMRGRDAARIRPGQVSLGRHTYGFVRSSANLPTGRERLRIGHYCSIARDVLFVFGEHRTDRVSTFPLRTLLTGSAENIDATDKGAITIGSDVWIGTRAMIMSGVKIHHGAVVAGGAVVTRDVPPYAIVGGVPARVIRFRFDEATIKSLLAIAWWEWPDQLVRERMPAFDGDVRAFITTYGAEER